MVLCSTNLCFIFRTQLQHYGLYFCKTPEQSQYNWFIQKAQTSGDGKVTEFVQV